MYELEAHYHLLDTFAELPFQGNPTPVCIFSTSIDSDLMEKLSKEFNAPVTAFAVRRSDACYDIRYFTIEGEIPACGHATLGAGQVILDENQSLNEVEFNTAEGIQVVASKSGKLVYLQYPLFKHEAVDVPPEMINALGVSDIKTAFYCKELESLFIELRNENLIKQITPDFKKLRSSSNTVKEVVVMSGSNLSEDFVLRSFCPWIGIDEDPVTGSIHSVLGPYWKERTGKSELKAYQASQRGGTVHVQVGDTSVQIGGISKTLISGQLTL